MASVEPEQKINEYVEPRQRIFQRNNQKIAVRLEEEFWNQLENCAREEKRKLSSLLFEILDNVQQSRNRASLIRVFCVRWLHQRLTQAKQATVSNPDLQAILSACPIPCVIMTAEKAIIAYNSAFAETIIARLTPKREPKGKDKNDRLTFRLAIPLEPIYEELVSGNAQYHDTKASFVWQRKTININARFCLIRSAYSGNHPLLCFITGV